MFRFIVTLVLFILSSVCYSNEAVSTDDIHFSSTTRFDIEEQELILQAKVDDLILGYFVVLQQENKIYIGLQEFFDIIDFPIVVNSTDRIAKGWFIKETYNFELINASTSFDTVLISVKGKNERISKSRFNFTSEEIYLDADVLFKLLEIEYIFNFNDLTIELIPSEKLPIQLTLARQARKSKSSSQTFSAQYPQVHRPYRLWSLPFADVQTLIRSRKNTNSISSYSALGGGDLAYMTGTYYLSGDQDRPFNHFRLTMSKRSLSNNLLGHLRATRFAFGDIAPTQTGGLGSSGQEVGVRLTNRPQGMIVNRNKTDFTGDALPGWDVELYRNSHYLAGMTVDESGRYEFFNQEVLFGDNDFTLVFYGPQGQREEITEKVSLTTGNYTRRGVIYDMSITQQNSQLFYLNERSSRSDEKPRRFNLNLVKNIGPSVSLETTYASYQFSDETRHNFIQSTFKTFLYDTLFNATLAKDLNAGYSLYAGLSRGLGKHSFSMSQVRTSSDYATNTGASEFRLLNSYSLAGPMLSAKLLKVSYLTEGLFSQLGNDRNINKFRFKLAAKSGRFSVSHNLNYSEAQQKESPKDRFLDGSLNSNAFFGKFSFRAGMTYDLEPSRNIALKKISGLNGNLSWLATANLKLNYNYKLNPASNFGFHTIAASWRTKRYNLVSNINYSNSNSYSAIFGINFSLGYHKQSSSLRMSSERISNTGAIAARIYADENLNGRYDEDESLLEGARIHALQARKSADSNANGKIFMLGLPSDRLVDIELDSASFEDPFLVSSQPAFSLLPRPGLVESIEIPVVASGEVEGTIYLQTVNTKHVREAGYVPLVLQNIKTRDKYQTSSAYDGFFVFTQVPPGKYLVLVDADYLKRFNYIVAKPARKLVEVTGEGNVVMGADFTLYAEAE